MVGVFPAIVEIKKWSSSWWISGVYGPCHTWGRSEFWDKVACSASLWRVKCTSMVYGSCLRWVQKHEELSLYDPLLSNLSFTWSDFGDESLCCRLDHFLVREECGPLFPFACVIDRRRHSSFRAPLETVERISRILPTLSVVCQIIEISSWRGYIPELAWVLFLIWTEEARLVVSWCSSSQSYQPSQCSSRLCSRSSCEISYGSFWRRRSGTW